MDMQIGMERGIREGIWCDAHAFYLGFLSHELGLDRDPRYPSPNRMADAFRSGWDLAKVRREKMSRSRLENGDLTERLAAALRDAIRMLDEISVEETGETFNRPVWNGLLEEFEREYGKGHLE
jgi:hypothetical protein